jgi:hypothetical protein
MTKQTLEQTEMIRIARKARSELKKARNFQGLDEKFEGEREHQYLGSYTQKRRGLYFSPSGASVEEELYFKDREATFHLSDGDLRARNAKSCDWRSFHDDPFKEKLHELTFSLDNEKRRLPRRSKDAVYEFRFYWDEKFDNRTLTEQEYMHIVKTPLPELIKEAIETGERLYAPVQEEHSRQYDKKLYVNYLSVQLQNPRTLKDIERDIIAYEHERKSKRQQKATHNKRLAELFADCRKKTGLVDLTSEKKYPFREISEFVEPLFQSLLHDSVPDSVEIYYALRNFFQNEFHVVWDKHITANWDDERFRKYCTELYMRKHTIGRVGDYVERKDPVYEKLGHLVGMIFEEDFAYGKEVLLYGSSLKGKMEARSMTEGEYHFLAKASEEDLVREAREKYSELHSTELRPSLEKYQPERICITPLTLALQNIKAKKLRVKKG